MDAQQEIYTELLKRLREAGYDVYDGELPPEDTPYPFIYLADSQQIDDTSKTALFGSVYQTVHVWHDDVRKRGTVSDMMLAIKSISRSIENTAHFGWYVKSADQRILSDDTTKQPLLHGVVDLSFKFS